MTSRWRTAALDDDGYCRAISRPLAASPNAGVAAKLPVQSDQLFSTLLWRLHSDLLFSIFAWMDARMAPQNRREPIFELAKKFQFLQENAVSRRQCGHDR